MGCAMLDTKTYGENSMTGKANDFPWTGIGAEDCGNIHCLNAKNFDHRWAHSTKRKIKGNI